MVNSTLISKLNFIIKKFIDNNAKTWEIGTDFFKSYEIFILKIKNLFNFRNTNYIFIRRYYPSNATENNRYKLYLNDYYHDVTPTKKNDGVAKSTIRQYLQEGSALGLLNYYNEEIEDNLKIEIMPNFYYILNQYDSNDKLIDYILLLLFQSYNTKIKFHLNLGFSLLLSLIHEYDENIFRKLDKYIIKPKTYRKDCIKGKDLYLNEELTINFINHIKGDDDKRFGKGKKTYKSSVIKILDKYEFIEIIDCLYNYMNGIKDINKIIDLPFDKQTKENKEKNELLQQKIKEIKNKRSYLRQNILVKRVWIWNNDRDLNQKYTEIENSEPNYTKLTNLDACHIYDINLIILNLKNYINSNKYENIDQEKIDEFINYSDNADNGILLTKTCHKLFDNKIVWFDFNGKLCWRNEEKEEIQKYFGQELEKICIKKTILTDEMKNFISIRNAINKTN